MKEEKNYPLEFLNEKGEWVLGNFYASQAHRLLSGAYKHIYRVPKVVKDDTNSNPNRTPKKAKRENERVD